MKVSILDYGLGNLYSIVNAFQYCGQRVQITNDEKEILRSDILVLPGVGAFSAGMHCLKKSGLDRVIGRFANTKQRLLGICLGMQLLMSSSEEFGSSPGLGLIPGKVKLITNIGKFNNSAKVPHIGWNNIQVKRKHLLFNNIQNSAMYFLHSYCVVTDNDKNTLASVRYGDCEFSAVVAKGNIFGCQFHPEKSAENGLQIIRNFLALV
jgi:imidazole glycerol-phosphate synthase subunit HisH